MRISFIIPVYNIRQWLARCLASVVAQGLSAEDYEIVIVNDGSTDDSMAVLEQFQAEQEAQGNHLHWTVVQQENQGLSAARNAGVRAATGQYVWWIDSDDFLLPAVLPALLDRAEREHLDVLCFGLQLAYEDGTIEPYAIHDATHGKVTTGEEFLLKVSMPPSAWAAIYRRQFILENRLEFLVGALHEDQDFTPRAYFLAERIAFQDVVVYNYFQREGSIMKSENLKKTDDLVLICHRLHDFAQKHTKAGTPIREVFENRIAFLFSQALANLCRCGKDTFPGDLKKLPFFPLKINDSESKRLRYKYRLINLSVPLYLKLYRKFAEKPETKPGLKELRTK